MAPGPEVSTPAMARPSLELASTQAPPAMAPAPPPRVGRPQVSLVSRPLVTQACGWRGQEERPLDTGPGPLTLEARHRVMALMAPATMAPATLLATRPLASTQVAPQEARVTMAHLEEDQVTMAHLEEDQVTAPSLTVITIPLVTDKNLPMWRPRDPMVSRCTMRPASSQHCPSHQTTQVDGKPPRETMARATPPHPARPTAPPRPAAWAPRRMTSSCPPAPPTLAGVTAGRPRPRPRTPRDQPRWRTSRDSTRSMTTPTGRPGWTSCSTSWRSAALQSPSVRPYPKTLSTFTSCTCTPRIGGVF